MSEVRVPVGQPPIAVAVQPQTSSTDPIVENWRVYKLLTTSVPVEWRAQEAGPTWQSNRGRLEVGSRSSLRR